MPSSYKFLKREIHTGNLNRLWIQASGEQISQLTTTRNKIKRKDTAKNLKIMSKTCEMSSEPPTNNLKWQSHLHGKWLSTR
jgi:hypothetical protein